MLVSQYAICKVEEGESIKDFVQIFTAITNQLMFLGRKFDKANFVHKVLRSLTEECQPKVTTIQESLKMGMLITQKLYGNLEEHEIELKRYKRNEDDERKKTPALKASSSFYDDKDEIDNDSRKMKMK